MSFSGITKKLIFTVLVICSINMMLVPDISAGVDSNERWLLKALKRARGQRKCSIYSLPEINYKYIDHKDALMCGNITAKQFWWIKDALAHFTLTFYKKAIELKPDWWRPYYRRGIVWRRFKQYEKALSDQDKSFKLNPKMKGKLLFQYCFTLMFARRYNRAISCFTRVSKDLPNNMMVYLFRGKACCVLGQLTLCQADLDQVKRMRSKHRGWQLYYFTKYFKYKFALPQSAYWEFRLLTFNKAVKYWNPFYRMPTPWLGWLQAGKPKKTKTNCRKCCAECCRRCCGR